MTERINELKSKIIGGVDAKEARVLEKRLQYNRVNEIYQDAAKSEALVFERYSEVERGIEDYADGSCPHCGEKAVRHLESLKAELKKLEPELTRHHEEKEFQAQRLLDIEIEINDLETEIHQAVRHNREVEREICYLQAEEQMQVA